MNDFEKPAAAKGINLDRNIPFESGLEYNKDHYYRMIGQSGYDDFLDTGTLQPKSESKREYRKTYFFKGQPLSRYAETQSRIQFFVEVKPSEGLFEVDGDGYPYTTRVITTKDQLRIYRHSQLDGTEIVFDSFEEV